jgi:serine/threonine-protein kinase
MKKSLSVLLITVLFITSCNKKNETVSASTKPTSTNPTVTVTILAGGGGAGYTNGSGTAAFFNDPLGLAVGATGNIYVGDADNNLIRKISPAGVVSTFAGGGVGSNTNGIGTTASFYGPVDVAIDATGNLYVADQNNNLIRKISPVGVVSTFAGGGVGSNTNGTGTTASFGSPQGIAVDASGNIYVAGGNLIRKITSSGVVTTLAGGGTNKSNANGDGMGIAASFVEPMGITVDTGGNVYVADFGDNLIRKITSSGAVTTIAGSFDVIGNTNGKGSAASFNNPLGIAVDAAGNLYVSDYRNNLIRKISPVGVVSTLVSMAGPKGIAVDVAGNIYVSDANDVIRKISVQ